MQIHTDEGKGDFLQGQLKNLQHSISFNLTHLYTIAIEQYAQIGKTREIDSVKIKPLFLII